MTSRVNLYMPVWMGEQRIAGNVGGGGSDTSLANLENFGAHLDGIANDTDAFLAAVQAVEAGRYSGVFMPQGLVKVTPGQLRIPTLQGVSLTGCGSADDLNIPKSRGTYIVSDGSNAGQPLLTIDGSNNFRLSHFTVVGNAAGSLTGAAGGIVLQNRTGSGLGGGQGLLDQVNTLWCPKGFETGVTDAEHNTGNGSDVSFLRCSFLCGTGFKSNGDQNVNFRWSGCSWTAPAAGAVAIDCPFGGNISVDMGATTDIDTFLRVGDGANGMQNTIDNLRVDGSSVYTRLYVASNSSNKATTSFRGVSINTGQLALTATSARIILKNRHRVDIRSSENLVSATGALFKLDGGGLFKADFCDLPDDIGQLLDSGSSGGHYYIRDCHDDGTPFAADYTA